MGKSTNLDVGGIRKDVDDLTRNMGFITFVLFVAFAAIFVTVMGILNDYLANKQATYQDLRDKVDDSNDLIQKQTEQISSLSTKIDNLNYLIRHPEAR